MSPCPWMRHPTPPVRERPDPSPFATRTEGLIGVSAGRSRRLSSSECRTGTLLVWSLSGMASVDTTLASCGPTGSAPHATPRSLWHVAMPNQHLPILGPGAPGTARDDSTTSVRESPRVGPRVSSLVPQIPEAHDGSPAFCGHAPVDTCELSPLAQVSHRAATRAGRYARCGSPASAPSLAAYESILGASRGRYVPSGQPPRL